MIINNTYFKGDIYLPHAKPGITDSITDVEAKVLDFIDQYEAECLEECFGNRLALEFFSNLDDTEPTLIKSGADAKWDELLNGKAYTNPSGDEVVWKGIRRVTTSLGSANSLVYDKSFLAQYVYFFYESNAHITRTNAGNAKIKSANAEMATHSQKSVKAWREFTKQVQGETDKNPYFIKGGIFGGVGADYYTGGYGSEISLYQFINDSNELVEDTYENFEPKEWGRINQLSM